MHTMEDLERLAKDVGEAYHAMHERANDLEEEIRALKRRRLTGIRNALDRAINARAALRDAVAENPELFTKPKSRTIHGVRFGYEKGKGKITWSDVAGVVRLIKRHFPGQADVLIKTTETPVRKALQQLPAQDLKRIGCLVEETDDAPFIRMVDSDLQKLLDSLAQDDDLDLEAA